MKEQEQEKMEYRHPNSTCKKDSRSLRIAVGIGLPFAGLILAYLVWRQVPTAPQAIFSFMFCPFNRLTGLYCPVCGMTRAAYELLHLHILRAIRDNALIVLLIGPGAAYMVLREYVNFLAGRIIWKQIPFPKWMFVSLITIAIVFTILRNIPVFPFTCLIPIV